MSAIGAFADGQLLATLCRYRPFDVATIAPALSVQ